MDAATVARLAASPSGASSRSHSSSSPSTSRLIHSGSAMGLNGEDAIMHSAVTAEQVLAAHASAPDPMRAALEAVVQERNTLNAQNSQLWNHLKKQRNNYQMAASDVKRIRQERDHLRVRLARYEQHPINQHSNDKRSRPQATTQSVTDPAADASADTDEKLALGSGYSSRSSSRPKPTRHHSVDRSGPSHSRDGSRDQQSQASTSHATPRDYVKAQHRERSNTHPEFTTPSGSEGPTSPTSSTTDSSAGRERITNDNPFQSMQRTASPAPLVIPPRTGSIPSGSASNTDYSLQDQVVLSRERQDFEDPPGTAKPTASKRAIPSINSPAQHPPENGRETNYHVGNVSASTLNNTGDKPQSSANLTPNYLTTAPFRIASRDSRISLPDEAKRYFANLGDSPLSSPHASRSVDAVKRSVNGETTLAQVPEEGDGRGHESASPRPFLELDTTDDSESDHRQSGDTRTRETDSEPGTENAGETMHDNRYSSARTDSSGHSTRQATKARLTMTAADQFPLPPSTYSIPPQSPTNSMHGGNGSAASNNGKTRSLMHSGSLLTSSSTALSPDTGSHRTREKVDSFIMPTNPAATFRQMPLLDTDLKTATVEVLGNHIRANDKGKEVLSFVIAIHVVGKESWQIEKFYSDVLALDSRLRTRCSRSTLKKLEPLPDNKLFKDHAPAKVDQRKRMLQAYLQSVMRLPIKDKNEIIVFFSSDVVRERSPVARNGYKEGYLTKRGKNFGGWKTRYFVLQGPVLEYYESRGGAHLGSIQITGAQIGRQQRTGSKADSDDENEFRHAFLIIEQKRGPAGQNTRHVLCAESDKERDAWVDVLVRYVMGSYNEDEKAVVSSASSVTNAPQSVVLQPRSSTSSLTHSETTSTRRVLSKDLIQKSNAMPIPISQLAVDGSTAKFFQTPDAMSPTKSQSPIDKGSVLSLPFESSGKGSLDKASAEEGAQPSSLPITSTLSDVTPGLTAISERSTSELGHYPDLHSGGKSSVSVEPLRPRERARASHYHVSTTSSDRPPSPEKVSPAPSSSSPSKDETTRLGKISGPINGAPIPAGYKFGGKDPTPEPQPSNDRERKARSRAFWRWPGGADKASNAQTVQNRAVFGVPLEDSLAVSQIANLPSIVFRSIQYLEAKKADQEEGIYRLSGSSAVIKNLKDKFNAEGDVDLLATDVQDPHAIAGLLKTFLRELPSSLLTRELHMRFLAVMDFVDTQERIRELQELVSQLPLANYSLLRALTAHLILIVQNAHVNKMTMRNVGIVFSPTLGIPAGVFSLMLGEFKRVFNVSGEGSDSPIEDPNDATASVPQRLSEGLNRRNSKRYSDAAADELLGLSGRSLPAMTEDHSDDGEDIPVDDQEESDDDATEAEAEISVRPHSSPPEYQEYVHPPSGEHDDASNKSRASAVAAQRGLNLNLSPANSKADRRRSRVPQGLPTSPRPAGNSPLLTPTFGNQADLPHDVQR